MTKCPIILTIKEIKAVIKEAAKAYPLFVRILHETNTIAIGKAVLREKEHRVALRAYHRGLVMHQLKYLDEIRPMDENKWNRYASENRC